MNRSDIKKLASSMSSAFRDSQGGGVVERFEAVSKLLFLDLYSRTHPNVMQGLDFRERTSDRETYERAKAVWGRMLTAEPELYEKSKSFPTDVPAVARCINLLSETDLSAFSSDIRGGVYEELLRNTFEKNENQQYFTPQNIVGFILDLVSPFHMKSVLDPACGSGGFLTGVATRRGVSECSIIGIDVDERMCWIARTNLITHGTGNGKVHHVPGSGSLGELSRVKELLPDSGVDLILENPPFGSDVYDKDVLSGFKTGRGRSSRRRSVLFLERSIDLLSDGGVMAIILDDSVLNLDANSDIRRIVRRECSVLAVISLPVVTFMPYSTAASSILILQKGFPQGKVFMAKASEVGRRANGDVLYSESGDVVSDLPEILSKWHEFRRTGKSGSDELGYACRLEDDLGSRLDANYYHPSRYVAKETLEASPHQLVALVDAFEFIGGSYSLAGDLAEESVSWLGLAEIEKLTGSYRTREVVGKSVRSQVHRFRCGDVLYSRLRPELRKAVFCDGDGYCSSELVVLRIKEDYKDKIDPRFVSIVLRSDLAFGQIVYKITGLGRPRVGVPTLRKVVIPVPTMAEQKVIVDEYNSALEQYRRTCRDMDAARHSAFGTLAAAQNASY